MVRTLVPPVRGAPSGVGPAMTAGQCGPCGLARLAPCLSFDSMDGSSHDARTTGDQVRSVSGSPFVARRT
jgi:hypothetical protein